MHVDDGADGVAADAVAAEVRRGRHRNARRHVRPAAVLRARRLALDARRLDGDGRRLARLCSGHLLVPGKHARRPGRRAAALRVRCPDTRRRRTIPGQTYQAPRHLHVTWPFILPGPSRYLARLIKHRGTSQATWPGSRFLVSWLFTLPGQTHQALRDLHATFTLLVSSATWPDSSSRAHASKTLASSDHRRHSPNAKTWRSVVLSCLLCPRPNPVFFLFPYLRGRESAKHRNVSQRRSPGRIPGRQRILAESPSVRRPGPAIHRGAAVVFLGLLISIAYISQRFHLDRLWSL